VDQSVTDADREDQNRGDRGSLGLERFVGLLEFVGLKFVEWGGGS
jgi:hypothetical protein